MKRIFRYLFSLPGLLLMLGLTVSCADSDYVDAIPSGSKAVIAIDIPQMATQSSLGAKANVVASLLKVADPADCGIDFGSKVYLFEAPDDNLGMAARVSSGKKLATWLDKLSQKRLAQPVSEERDVRFSVLKDNWVVAFDDRAVLIMGPVLATDQARLRQQMSRYLRQSEDDGIRQTALFERLDSIGGGMSMVAQVQALPENLVPMFMLGAPKDADGSQVMLAARMSVADGCLRVEGEPFSFNKSVDRALKESAGVFRTIRGDYARCMGADALVGIFMNVEGGRLLGLLQQDRGLSALLAGVNTAIDMDNIIRSIDGDMALVMPNGTANNFKLTMAARLADTRFLADVDYWKQSCPQGSRITDEGNQTWSYSGGQTAFHFGVTPDKQFFLGSTLEGARSAVAPAKNAMPNGASSLVAGQRMVAVINLAQVDNEAVATASTLLQPLFGRLNSIVYCRK